MDDGLSRSAINRESDPHGWNSYDNYQIVHQKSLEEHSFLDDSRSSTIELGFTELGGATFCSVRGMCYCQRNVIVEVEKLLETRYAGNILQVRGIRYLYVAWVRGGHLVLKYHNWHQDQSVYVHRAFDSRTGDELLYEELSRFQFPVFLKYWTKRNC